MSGVRGPNPNPWMDQPNIDLGSPNSNFLLQPIKESQPPMSMASDLRPPFPPMSAADSFAMQSEAINQFPIGTSMNEMTIMQKLQADRRRRLIDYQQKLMKSK